MRNYRHIQLNLLHPLSVLRSSVSTAAGMSEDVLDGLCVDRPSRHIYEGQAIAVSEHRKFAESFGDPEPPHPIYPHHPECSKSWCCIHSHTIHLALDGWHTDVTFRKTPPFASILWAKQIQGSAGTPFGFSSARMTLFPEVFNPRLKS